MSRSNPQPLPEHPAKAQKCPQEASPSPIPPGDGAIDAEAIARASRIQEEAAAAYKAKVEAGKQLNSLAIAQSKRKPTPHVHVQPMEPATKTPLDLLREFVGRNTNLYICCQRAAEYANKKCADRNGGNPMSPAAILAMTTSLYNSAEERGLADGLSHEMIEEILPRKVI